jgi:hypothetical protein
MKLKNRTYTLVFLVAIFILATFAMVFADSTDLEKLEKKETFDKAISALDEIAVYLKNTNKENKTLCFKAFGHETFCTCLAENMPGPGMIVLSFYEYIAATTKSKKDLKYNQLPDDQKEAIDRLRKLREKCVGELNR